MPFLCVKSRFWVETYFQSKGTWSKDKSLKLSVFKRQPAILIKIALIVEKRPSGIIIFSFAFLKTE